MELPSDAMIRALLGRYARLRTRLRDELGVRPLVLPASEFFPDRFTADAKSAARLVRRMRGHAGMSDIPIKTRVLGSARAEAGGSCGTGGCGTGACETPSDEPQPRIVDRGDYWRVQIPEPELGHPTVVTTGVARALGAIFLLETRADDTAIEEPFEVSVDVAATALGFGALLMQGSYIYSKSCGGPSVARATRLGCPELSVLTAFDALVHGHTLKRVGKHLDTTQAALFATARELAESNSQLVARLRDEPASVSEDTLQLKDARPWLSRVLGIGDKKKPTAELPDEIAISDLETLLAATPATPARPKARDPKHDELAALVAEALDDDPGKSLTRGARAASR